MNKQNKILLIAAIIIAGIIVFGGTIGKWTGVINEQVRYAISRLVFNITLPFLIVTTISRMEMSKEVLVNGLGHLYLLLSLSV